MRVYLKQLSIIYVLVFIFGFGPIGVSNLGTGLNVVVNGDFAATSEANVYTSDFSTDEDSWTVAANGAVAGNIDNIGGAENDDNFRFTLDATDGLHGVQQDSGTIVVGKTYRLRFDYYIPSTNSHLDGVQAFSGDVLGTKGTTIDAWTTLDYYWTATQVYLQFYAYDGATNSFQDAGGDDVFYLRNVIIDAVTIDTWDDTAAGLSAGTDGAGALNGKASWDGSQAAASTLTQSGILWPGGTHTFVITTTRSAGTITPKCGSTSGTARSSADTFTEQIVCAGSDLSFEADAAFIGTLDTVTAGKY